MYRLGDQNGHKKGRTCTALPRMNESPEDWVHSDSNQKKNRYDPEDKNEREHDF